MIYTVTFNPSLDYYVQVNNFKSGIVNRAANERLAVGGKGINVSLALRELGEETFALGFVAGFTGNAIKNKVNSLGLDAHFFDVEGQSRINVKIKGNTETDINGTGACISQSDINALVRKLKAMLKEGDWVVISGSIPLNLDEMTYANFIKKIKTVHGVNIVVDACGKLLTETLKYKPFLIKPNLYELSEIFSLNTVPDIEQISACASHWEARARLW